MGRLDNKVCIVTGSNSGVGAATAELFASEGAKVVITARRQELLDAEAEKIKAAGGTVLAVRCDVSKEEDCIELVRKTVEAFGTVDVLVNKKDDSGNITTKIAYKDLKILRVSTNAENSTASQSGTKITKYSTLTVEVTKKQALKLYEIENEYDYKLILNPRR